MIKPTKADIGRHVIYTPYGDYEHKKIEEGVITSFNDKVVFVRYGSGSTSAATDPADLEFSTPTTAVRAAEIAWNKLGADE